MFYLAGIIITFFLAVILLTKKGKTAADRVLASWLCIMGFHLFLYYQYITGDIFSRSYLLGLHIPLPLIHGPLLYIYTQTLSRSSRFSNKFWLHFIPVAVAYATLSGFYLLPADEKINVYKNHGAGYEIHSGVILIAAIISGFGYVLLSFYELRLYRKRILEAYSETEKINLNWLRYLIYGILLIWITIVMDLNDSILFGVVVVFVLLLGYFGIKHLGIFTYERESEKDIINLRVQDEETDIPGEDLSIQADAASNGVAGLIIPQAKIQPTQMRTRYITSGLIKETADKIHQDLNKIIKEEKVFKKEELSLAQLADHLGVHPHNLSQVINTYENKTFYDYINTLRIEEFKELVLLPQNSRYTLLSLAFECGFNSKTSFNRNFKKITGQSPSAYLKDVNVQLVGE
jgi:AraC-like DNA-binding protein